MSNQVVFVSAARTAIGSFGKSLKDVPATHLGAIAVEGAVAGPASNRLASATWFWVM